MEKASSLMLQIRLRQSYYIALPYENCSSEELFQQFRHVSNCILKQNPKFIISSQKISMKTHRSL